MNNDDVFTWYFIIYNF